MSEQPLNVASCGECFETWSEPASDSFSPANEVQVHAEAEGHRLDVNFGVIE